MRSPFRTTAFRVASLGLAWTALFLSGASAADLYVRVTPCPPLDCPASFPSPWSTPYFSLQDALAASTSGDTIHVAVGTYYPDNGAGFTPGDRNAAFILKERVTLKGGYAGVPILPDPNIPDPGDPVGALTGRSKLSGDIGASGGNTDNSLVVVYSPPGVTSATVFDGFDVENGCPLGTLCQALRVWGSYPTVSNSSFKGNALNGGAVMINGPNGQIYWTNVTAEGNATNLGGAIYAASSSQPIRLDNLNATGTADEGGGLYLIAQKLTLSGQIHHSKARRAAGLRFSGHEAYLTGVTLEANEALDDLGGGELLASRVIEVANSFVRDNAALGFFGTASPTGGLRLSGGRQKVLLTTFERNKAFGFDPPTSALELEGSDFLTGAEVINCLFSGLPFYSSVLLHFNGGGPGLVADSTFSGPGCQDAGQGYFGEAGIRWTNSSLKVANTILSEHDPFDFDPVSPTTFVASQVYGLGITGLFASPTCVPAPGSPLIDAGDNSEIPPGLTTSLNGARRRGICPNPTVDVGAYESIPETRACFGDWDSDCFVTVSDIFAYLNDWFAVNPVADLDGDGDVDIIDLQGIFLPAWFAGCP